MPLKSHSIILYLGGLLKIKPSVVVSASCIQTHPIHRRRAAGERTDPAAPSGEGRGWTPSAADDVSRGLGIRPISRSPSRTRLKRCIAWRVTSMPYVLVPCQWLGLLSADQVPGIGVPSPSATYLSTEGLSCKCDYLGVLHMGRRKGTAVLWRPSSKRSPLMAARNPDSSKVHPASQQGMFAVSTQDIVYRTKCKTSIEGGLAFGISLKYTAPDDLIRFRQSADVSVSEVDRRMTKQPLEASSMRRTKLQNHDRISDAHAHQYWGGGVRAISYGKSPIQALSHLKNGGSYSDFSFPRTALTDLSAAKRDFTVDRPFFKKW